MQIWEVARAATAAPMYFKELKVPLWLDGETQKAYFTDGGFGVTNNPTQAGFKEVKALSGSETAENVGVIVSIGTARAKELPGKGGVRTVKRMVSSATDPNTVAGWMNDQKLDHYWRFNNDQDGLSVELDEWKPNSWFTKRPGHETLTTILHNFNAWAAQSENYHAIEKCAKELVKQRRARTPDRSRWQRFATGATKYRCSHKDCKNDAWDSLYQFNLHWDASHQNDSRREDYKQPSFETWTYQRQNGRHKALKKVTTWQ